MSSSCDEDADLAAFLLLIDEANQIVLNDRAVSINTEETMQRITDSMNSFSLPFNIKLDDYDLDEFMEKVSPEKLRAAKYYEIPPYISSVMMPFGSPINDEDYYTDDDDSMEKTSIEMPPLPVDIPTASFVIPEISPPFASTSTMALRIPEFREIQRRAQSTTRKDLHYDLHRTLNTDSDSECEIAIDDRVNEKTLRETTSTAVIDWASEVFDDEKMDF